MRDFYSFYHEIKDRIRSGYKASEALHEVSDNTDMTDDEFYFLECMLIAEELLWKQQHI